MFLKRLHTALFSIALLISSFSTLLANNGNYTLLTKQTAFEAGAPINLKFSTKTTKTTLLYISNSFGATLLKATTENTILTFEIPKAITSKSGVIHWKLLAKNNPLAGILTILQAQNVKKIQTYLGPPSIAAGREDFSMLVAIPTDVYDNPLADSTEVKITHLFLNEQINDVVYIKNGISYKNIYSPFKTGRIFLSSSCLGFNSKEYDVNVLPDIPTNFTIAFKRHHEFADGNQITSFQTSIIKDTYGNTVSDGTYVAFFIRTALKTILKTSGVTIDGIAHAKMIHPNHKAQWTVKGYIEGMAESNTITLNFKPVISDFEVQLSKENRKVTIGPLKSFMNQKIPDGMEVKLAIYENDTLKHTLRKPTSEGYTEFNLKLDQFPEATYHLEIEVAGIIKSFNNIKL